jgi:Cu(I)/Ag(I) efflux system membrane protein CusA/SilA
MPIAVLLAFIPFRLMGISANIMSLAGVAIAFSELVDASIVVVEQTHKKLELWDKSGRTRDCREVVVEAIKEVAGPTFFSLLVIAVSFLPVLTLQAQEGRMFRPLAYTKTLTMVVAAFLAITLDPALRLLLTRVERFSFRPKWLCWVANAVLVGEVKPEDRHPVSRRLIRVYEPVVRWTLRWKWLVIGAAVAVIIATIPVFRHLGSESMPPLDEGAILYMPTTLPGISISQAQQLLQVSDRMIRQFPEVDRVLGKAGRAETATDPAPLSMLETVVTLKPRAGWPRIDTWYSPWAPEWAKRVLRHFTPDIISTEELVSHMNAALKIPGVSNSWTMPIRGRIDMLTTGIRTPVGLKIAGGGFAAHPGNRLRNRIVAEDGKGNPHSACGAHGRRLFSRSAMGPRATGALWDQRRGCAESGRECDRRRQRQHGCTRAGAISGERTLPARFPQRPWGAQPYPGFGKRSAAAAIERSGEDRHRQRARDDSQ